MKGRAKRQLSLALMAAVCAPTSAMAATPTPPKKFPRYTFTFEGRGYGHGIGMSQYGAQGAALAGSSAAQIIAHYYRGTSLSVLPVTPVRVLLASNAQTVTLTGVGGWNVTPDGGVPTTLPVDVPLTVALLAPTGVTITDPNGVVVLTSPSPVRFAPLDQNSSIALKGVRYRGTMRILPEASTVSVVNEVNLEQYLIGVVPREMPSSWAPAALQAQAIAARSYAMATKRSGGQFDMYADERSQVYGGINAEHPRTTEAVKATAGQVVVFNGKIIPTFFFSTSGGKTENVENVWAGSPKPYLVSVSDASFDALSPHHIWKTPRTFTDTELGARLGFRRPILQMTVVQRGLSPRVKVVKVTSRSGVVKFMRGSEIRFKLGLRDTWFTPRKQVRGPIPLRRTAAAPVDPPALVP